ncbi:Chromosome segregation protein [Giardia muris]|uniref:Chromosome segregation protein n=1 Tax=Giardia muris TaxID=5742 RepID=A0A4Z1SPQ8_GIAMU|nr:Chromosome segregation protein [Giardia muris]|eukprot:TNJ27814.1 Chromosome segregation protein [Giardia muris]
MTAPAPAASKSGTRPRSAMRDGPTRTSRSGTPADRPNPGTTRSRGSTPVRRPTASALAGAISATFNEMLADTRPDLVDRGRALEAQLRAFEHQHGCLSASTSLQTSTPRPDPGPAPRRDDVLARQLQTALHENDELLREQYRLRDLASQKDLHLSDLQHALRTRNGEIHRLTSLLKSAEQLDKAKTQELRSYLTECESITRHNEGIIAEAATELHALRSSSARLSAEAEARGAQLRELGDELHVRENENATLRARCDELERRLRKVKRNAEKLIVERDLELARARDSESAAHDELAALRLEATAYRDGLRYLQLRIEAFETAPWDISALTAGDVPEEIPLARVDPLRTLVDRLFRGVGETLARLIEECNSSRSDPLQPSSGLAIGHQDLTFDRLTTATDLSHRTTIDQTNFTSDTNSDLSTLREQLSAVSALQKDNSRLLSRFLDIEARLEAARGREEALRHELYCTARERDSRPTTIMYTMIEDRLRQAEDRSLWILARAELTSEDFRAVAIREIHRMTVQTQEVTALQFRLALAEQDRKHLLTEAATASDDEAAGLRRELEATTRTLDRMLAQKNAEIQALQRQLEVSDVVSTPDRRIYESTIAQLREQIAHLSTPARLEPPPLDAQIVLRPNLFSTIKPTETAVRDVLERSLELTDRVGEIHSDMSGFQAAIERLSTHDTSLILTSP